MKDRMIGSTGQKMLEWLVVRGISDQVSGKNIGTWKMMR